MMSSAWVALLWLSRTKPMRCHSIHVAPDSSERRPQSEAEGENYGLNPRGVPKQIMSFVVCAATAHALYFQYIPWLAAGFWSLAAPSRTSVFGAQTSTDVPSRTSFRVYCVLYKCAMATNRRAKVPTIDIEVDPARRIRNRR